MSLCAAPFLFRSLARTFVILSIGITANLSAVETEADLTNLEISGATLAPAFARDTTVYSASVPFAASEITLSGTPFASATAGIRTRLNGESSRAGLPLTLPLRTGANRIALRINASGTPLADFPFSAGTTRNLALHPDGYVLQWGVAASDTPPALPTAALSDVAGVFSGPGGEYLLKTDGSLHRLSGGNLPSDLVTGVAGVTQPRVVAVDIGSSFAIALRADGTVRTWGSFTTPDTTGVIDVAVGNFHALGLLANGRVTAWGSTNSFGVLDVPAAARSGIVAIAARGYRNLALKADGTLVQWGQVNSTQAAIPPAATDIVAIALNNNSNFALTRSGAVVAWGDATSSIDQPPAGLANVVALKTGPLHQIALKADGSLVAWGRNSSSVAAISPTGFAPLFTAPIRDYVVTVDRVIPSPALASLSLSAGTLSPVFDPATLAYSATVPYGTTSLALDATALAADTASLRHRLNGAASQADLPASLPLRLGVNHIALRVTAGGPAARDFAFAAGANRNLAVSSAGAVMHHPVSVNGSSLTTLPAGSEANVVGVFSGNYGEYALKTDGTLLRLSGATVPEAAQPASPVGGPVRAPIASVAVGQSHVLLLRTDGTTFAWGATTSVNTIPADAQSGMIAIASGANHVQALRADGRVVAWGSNSSGESYVPPGLKADIVAIASYGQRNLALRADGLVIAWGNANYLYDYAPLAAQSNVVAIAAGLYANVALKADGTLVVWGNDTAPNLQPPAAAQANVVAIACGPRHQLALKSDGSLVAWGPTSGSNPAIAPAFPAPLIDAPVRDYHLRIERFAPPAALAHLAVQAPGAGAIAPAFAPETASYTLGNSTPYPGLALHGLPFATQDKLELRVGADAFLPVTSGQVMSFGQVGGTALRADGSVLAWGPQIDAVPVAARSDVVSVASGGTHATALKSDGSLVGWGDNTAGKASPPVGMKATAIAAGNAFTVAIQPGGAPAIWGYVSGTLLAYIPADALDLVAVAAGMEHVLALRRDGRVVCWGGYSAGSTPLTTIPTDAQSDVVAIAAGGGFNLALRADGRVVSWGSSYQGLDLVPPAATYGVIAIAAGSAHAIALKADGSVVSWGDPFSAPVWLPPGYFPNIIGIASGANSTVALLRDGSAINLGSSLGNAPASFLAGPYTLPVSARLPLALGANTIQLRATTRDDTTTRTYTLGVTRSPAPVLDLLLSSIPPPNYPYLDGLGRFTFDPQKIGQTSAPVSWTVRNSGTANLELTAIDLVGTHASEFAVSGISLPLTLTPGSETTLALSATPTATGTRSATLRLYANLPHGGPIHLPLRVSGITLAYELTNWRSARFTSAELAALELEASVWGDLADPDGDGLPNLLEYAVNSAPKTANPAAATFALDASVPGEPVLTLTYVRVKRAVIAGLAYRIEWTDTLAVAGSWTDLDVTEEVVSSASTTETIRASIPAAASARFLRLRVTVP